jgi:hypothetical protein
MIHERRSLKEAKAPYLKVLNGAAVNCPIDSYIMMCR